MKPAAPTVTVAGPQFVRSRERPATVCAPRDTVRATLPPGWVVPAYVPSIVTSMPV
jgi:hypothetical protein